MFRQIGINLRVQLAFALVILGTVAALVWISLDRARDLIHEAEVRELEGYRANIAAMLEEQGRMAEALALAVARNPEVRAAFERRDREGLLRLVQDSYQALKERYGVRQFQFHLPPAISFLRVHKPAKFGDDLSGFRHTVVNVNAIVEPIHGVERGVAGLGIRGVVPVFDSGGEHLGSVEFGLSLGERFFEHFREQYGVSANLYLRKGDGFERYVNTAGEHDWSSEAALQGAWSGGNALHSVDYQGEPHAVFLSALNDYSGSPFGVLELVMDSRAYQAAVADTRGLLVGAGLVALVIGLILFRFIVRSVVRPLGEAVQSMEDIASGEGDLTRRLPVEGRDEVAQLAEAFNRFVEKMQRAVSEVASSSVQVSTAADAMSSITSQTSAGVERQRSEIEQVATAMNEMTATVQEVASHAAHAAEAATSARDEAQGGQRVVSANIDAIQRLADEVMQTAELINRLAEDSNAIGTVLDVIRGIAEQTNLLALNAAIEAARAGEQGRGFAVVADEVRTLAQRTQESTSEIQDMIERLQAGARNAVEAMEKGRAGAESSVRQAVTAGESLQAINQAVAAISDMNLQIATAAEEQSAVAEEINRNITTINMVADETAVGAEQTAEASQELAQLAMNLQRIVSQFRV